MGDLGQLPDLNVRPVVGGGALVALGVVGSWPPGSASEAHPQLIVVSFDWWTSCWHVN